MSGAIAIIRAYRPAELITAVDSATPDDRPLALARLREGITRRRAADYRKLASELEATLDQALGNESPVIRKAALDVLSRMSISTLDIESFRDRLERQLQTTDDDAERATCAGLLAGLLASQHDSAALLSLLEDPEPEVLRNALHAVARNPLPDAQLEEILSLLLKTGCSLGLPFGLDPGDWLARRASKMDADLRDAVAIQLLGTIARHGCVWPEDRNLRRGLQSLLAQQNESRRWTAANALTALAYADAHREDPDLPDWPAERIRSFSEHDDIYVQQGTYQFFADLAAGDLSSASADHFRAPIFAPPVVAFLEKGRRSAATVEAQNYALRALADHALNAKDWPLIERLLDENDYVAGETYRRIWSRVVAQDYDIAPLLDRFLPEYIKAESKFEFYKFDLIFRHMAAHPERARAIAERLSGLPAPEDNLLNERLRSCRQARFDPPLAPSDWLVFADEMEALGDEERAREARERARFIDSEGMD